MAVGYREGDDGPLSLRQMQTATWWGTSATPMKTGRVLTKIGLIGPLYFPLNVASALCGVAFICTPAEQVIPITSPPFLPVGLRLTWLTARGQVNGGSTAEAPKQRQRTW